MENKKAVCTVEYTVDKEKEVLRSELSINGTELYAMYYFAEEIRKLIDAVIIKGKQIKIDKINVDI